MHTQRVSGEQAGPALPCEIAADDMPAARNGHYRPGKAVTASVYRAKVAGHSRVVTVSWSRDLLSHAFAVAISGADGASAECRVDLRPWQFWRRAGSRRVNLGGATVRVLWDLRRARWHGAGAGLPDPRAGYYVAVEAGGEVALVLGDLRKAALRRASPSSAPPALAAVPVARREHVFGRRRFAAKARFHDQGAVHDVAIDVGGEDDMEMAIAIDGEEAVAVKHLQWKFRGNQSVTFGRAKVEVYWDVHDWLFAGAAGGARPALFIFRPIVLSSASVGASTPLLAGVDGAAGATGFCLYLYAWKLD
ncbi:hypothetical protein CFC21_004942 [Triticum aestivum]|uniref:DUF868 domain-containing protein n=2 Tax=Triticum aestivum TaxID=4565 RepID=A0A9R1D8L4_WHEAT|nr:hypothetical protein CFC21_004941 [Triticum aestivum]KAF6987284.1 hypothetical protein CFC21_004942 [Triticum aestivum]